MASRCRRPFSASSDAWYRKARMDSLLAEVGTGPGGRPSGWMPVEGAFGPSHGAVSAPAPARPAAKMARAATAAVVIRDSLFLEHLASSILRDSSERAGGSRARV